MIAKWLLGNEQKAKPVSVVWNTIGCAINAGQSAIILIFISSRLGLVIAGMVTFAYALAQVFFSIARYGARNYQVTDVKEQTSFREYLSVRYITLAGTGAALAVYLFIALGTESCTPEKAWIILEMVILKLIDAVEDVYIGRFQQTGRLDIGAKIMAVRLIISTALICIFVLAGTNIFIALLIGIVSSVAMDVYFIGITFRAFFPERQQKADRSRMGRLLIACLPLCISTTLSIYIGNAPKYMINNVMDESAQAIFGYIMMPVFVIVMVNQFIYLPVIKDLGDLWSEGKVAAFRKRVYRQCLIVAGLMVLAIVLGMTIGLPVLSFLYSTDLSGYRAEFAVLLLGGGFYALASYLNVPITTIRKQRSLAVGFIIAAVVSVVTGKWFVIHFGMMGAAILYLVITLLLAVIYFGVLMLGTRKKEETGEDSL